MGRNPYDRHEKPHQACAVSADMDFSSMLYRDTRFQQGAMNEGNRHYDDNNIAESALYTNRSEPGFWGDSFGSAMRVGAIKQPWTNKFKNWWDRVWSTTEEEAGLS